DHLVGVEEPPDLIHSLHQRAVDYLERRHGFERLVEILDEPVLGAFKDVSGQPLQERKSLAILARGPSPARAEMSGKGADRIFSAPPDQILGQFAFLFRNRRIPFELFRVDYREIE